MLGVTLAAGCLTVPQTTAEDLAGRAGRNMVEAQQNLAGKRLVVRGVVKETTLAPRSRVVTSGYPYGWTKTAVVQGEQVPLVILQPGLELRPRTLELGGREHVLDHDQAVAPQHGAQRRVGRRGHQPSHAAAQRCTAHPGGAYPSSPEVMP